MSFVHLIYLRSFKTYLGNKTHGPMYGVDPEFGRTIEIDLSKERMHRAWEAYKIRWEREESNRRALEETKLVRIKNAQMCDN